MSLLWTKAMAWHNDDREDEPEGAVDPRPADQWRAPGDEDWGFRDKRPYAERRPEYVKHISFIHDVPEHAASKALETVERGLRSNAPFGSTTHDYGMRPSTHSDLIGRPGVMKRLHDPGAWESAREEDVPLKHVVPTQDWVRHSGVAHNLFHSGIRAPYQEHMEGDPDYDPDWDSDSWAEEENDRKSSPDDYGPSDNHVTHMPRFYRNHLGTVFSVDGHHRLAADTALGKTHVKGLVLDHTDVG